MLSFFHHVFFIVFSDSLSALQSLNLVKYDASTSRHIFDIKKKFSDIQEYLGFGRRTTSCFVGIYWIPSHAGNSGNGLADGLARIASDQTQVVPKFYHPQDLKAHFRALTHDCTKTRVYVQQLLLGPRQVTSNGRTRGRARIINVVTVKEPHTHRERVRGGEIREY